MNTFAKLSIGVGIVLLFTLAVSVLTSKPVNNIQTEVPILFNYSDKISQKDSKPIVTKIQNVSIDSTRVVRVFGEVSGSSMSQAIKELNDLAKSTDPIWVVIASPGGSVFAGEQLVTAMESAKGPVYTVCVSLCASMGAIIHQHGTKRFAYDRAILMFHDAAGGLQGEVKKMHSMLSMIEYKIEREDRYIAARSHMTYEQFLDLHKYDLWLDASQAAGYNLVDGLIKSQNLDLGGVESPEELFKKIPNKTVIELKF